MTVTRRHWIIETDRNLVSVSAPKLTYNVVSVQFRLRWRCTSTLSVFGRNSSTNCRTSPKVDTGKPWPSPLTTITTAVHGHSQWYGTQLPEQRQITSTSNGKPSREATGQQTKLTFSCSHCWSTVHWSSSLQTLVVRRSRPSANKLYMVACKVVMGAYCHEVEEEQLTVHTMDCCK